MPAAAAAAWEALKPPLKWAGGKRWQVPHLIPLWKPHAERRLVEPFCGGLAVALGLRPGRALLNDANPHLIRFYQWLKKGLRITIPCENHERLFYQHRDRFNALLRSGKANSQEAAALFYYLNRTGYNGLCRLNSRGEFNVPFGRYKTITYARSFPGLRDALSKWEFTCGDFASLTLRRDDFVYADPPYDVEFTAYCKGGFSWDDQTRLAEWLARHKGPVVLVNQGTARVETLYRKLHYEVRFLDAPRRISCTGDRAPAREVVATRNL
jgi:DNA adenine methylase